MKPKGIKTIALLLAAVILVIGSVAGAGTGYAGDPLRTDVYWWEDERWKELGDLSPCEREIVRDILIHILDNYFGVDVSGLSFEQAGEVGRIIDYNVLREKLPPLFEYYAQKKGFEIPEPKGPAPLSPQPDPYWWEIVADPEGKVEWIMEEIAAAKGMFPHEVSERFCEFFPGVDLWKMTFGEFDEFLRNKPRSPLPPLRPVCFHQLKQNPLIIGLFGRVPYLQTEEQLEEFTQKLHKVLDVALPVLRQLPRCEFPFAGFIVSSGGAINVAVHCLDFPMEEVYEIIGDKAEMFGIEDVPVVFNDGRGAGPQAGPTWGDALGLSSSGWQAPWNEPYVYPRRIPGAVKVTPAGRPDAYSTASFAVQRPRWYWPWDPDEDYIITGHKGPHVRCPETGQWVPTITPVNMRIYQPLSPHAAGSVAENVGRITYADAARVAICDTRVQPYILIGGSPSTPVLRPIFDAEDPPDPKLRPRIWISAARTGLTIQVTVYRYGTLHGWAPWEELRDQLLVRPVRDTWAMDGDSGSPFWSPVWCPTRGRGAKIHGLYFGWIPINGRPYMVFSPVSGLLHEFPAWPVWRK
ncbi:hypothetical protein M1O57_04930 [Dehalococcoidia bacterium]|nr:hypothetical protein [Dehalococcoidia bacterium]MCL0104913.1 hypothetical protein [Dehalococcoidia bacterium]